MLMKSIIKKFILLAGSAGADACVDVPSAMRDRLNPRMNLYLIGMRRPHAYILGSAELAPTRSPTGQSVDEGFMCSRFATQRAQNQSGGNDDFSHPENIDRGKAVCNLVLRRMWLTLTER